MPADASPTPVWILRHHSPSPIHALSFSSSQPELLLAGDAQGRVSLTSIVDYRPRVFWEAHSDSILGVEAIGQCILTQGRDNAVHLWTLLSAEEGKSHVKTVARHSSAGQTLPSRIVSSLPQPRKLYTIEINALNYCRFSVLGLSDGQLSASPDFEEALMAVPNTLESEWIDVYHLPSRKRVSNAIGRPDIQSTESRKRDRNGITMALHLFRRPMTTASSSSSSFTFATGLLGAYEDGSVALYSSESATTSASLDFQCLWRVREHSEPVMSLSTPPFTSFAISVSADERVVRYDLPESCLSSSASERSNDGPECAILSTRHAGRAAVSIRQDGRVAAVGGWDGKARLYETTSFRPLAVLQYHRDSIQCVAFARAAERQERVKTNRLQEPSAEISSQDASTVAAESAADHDSDSDSDSDSPDLPLSSSLSSRGRQPEDVQRWLAVGGKDGKVSLWDLDFGPR